MLVGPASGTTAVQKHEAKWRGDAVLAAVLDGELRRFLRSSFGEQF